LRTTPLPSGGKKAKGFLLFPFLKPFQQLLFGCRKNRGVSQLVQHPDGLAHLLNRGVAVRTCGDMVFKSRLKVLMLVVPMELTTPWFLSSARSGVGQGLLQILAI
jgi:hypothetical protein